MVPANEYRHKATEFAKLAERQRNPELRGQLRALSVGFTRLAEARERERHLNGKINGKSPSKSLDGLAVWYIRPLQQRALQEMALCSLLSFPHELTWTRAIAAVN
jgi:hypothetical protein